MFLSQRRLLSSKVFGGRNKGYDDYDSDGDPFQIVSNHYSRSELSGNKKIIKSKQPQLLRHESVTTYSKTFQNLKAIKQPSGDNDEDLIIADPEYEELTVEKYESLYKNKYRMKKKHGYFDMEENKDGRDEDEGEDEVMKNRISSILCDYEYEKYLSGRVPSTLTIENICELLKMDSINARKNFLVALHKWEQRRLIREAKHAKHIEMYNQEKDKRIEAMNSDKRSGIWDNNGRIVYGLWHNSLVTKIMPTNIKSLHNSKMRTVALFGQKVVIDMSPFIKDSFSNISGKKLLQLYGVNKYKLIQPFDIHLCNMRLASEQVVKNLPQHLVNWRETQSFTPIYNQSYMDLFPSDKLVYLTQLAKTPLVADNFDPEDIFIIPNRLNHFEKFIKLDSPSSSSSSNSYAFSSSSYSNKVPSVSSHNLPLGHGVNHEYLRVLNKEKIRTMRIPFHEYVVWKSGYWIKIDLADVLSLLHDFSLTKDWRFTFDNNLRYRMKPIEDIMVEDKIRAKRMMLRRQVDSRDKLRVLGRVKDVLS